MNWSNLKHYSEIQQKGQKKIPSKTLAESHHNNIACVHKQLAYSPEYGKKVDCRVGTWREKK